MATAEIARGFTAGFGAGELGYALGLLHDAGKAHCVWQDRLARVQEGPDPAARIGIPHADVGAWMLRDRAGHAAIAILGHHSGLKHPMNLRDLAVADHDRRRCADARARFLAEVPDAADVLTGPDLVPPAWVADPLLYDLGIRLVFSALVDADWIDTAAHFARTSPLSPLCHDFGRDLDPDAALARYTSSRPGLVADLTRSAHSPAGDTHQPLCPSPEITAAAALPQALFPLVLPESVDRVVTALDFALHHARRHRLRRIVIAHRPDSLIAADTYIGHLDGIVLDHRSRIAVTDPRQKAATENWDQPIVVTTSTALLEALFAAHPTDVRGLHRLTGSVVIIHDADTLPPHLLNPVLDVLRLLVTSFGVTMVLTSAIDTGLRDLPVLRSAPVSIVTTSAPARPRRTRWQSRLDTHTTVHDLTAAALDHDQALLVVNDPDHAQHLAHALRDHTSRHTVLHVSERMHPAHRAATLTALHAHLHDGHDVLVVATPIIETATGVTVPVAYRELAAPELLLRCAALTGDGGTVSVLNPFSPDDPHTAATLAYTRHHFGHDLARLTDPNARRAYRQTLHRHWQLDRTRPPRDHWHRQTWEQINDARTSHDYTRVTSLFHTAAPTIPAVITSPDAPHPPASLTALVHTVRDPATTHRKRKTLLRALQPYIVALPSSHVPTGSSSVYGDLIEWVGPYDTLTGVRLATSEPQA